MSAVDSKYFVSYDSLCCLCCLSKTKAYKLQKKFDCAVHILTKTAVTDTSPATKRAFMTTKGSWCWRELMKKLWRWYLLQVILHQVIQSTYALKGLLKFSQIAFHESQIYYKHLVSPNQLDADELSKSSPGFLSNIKTGRYGSPQLLHCVQK